MIYLKPWAKEDSFVLTELFNNIKIWNNLRDYFPNPYTIEDANEFIENQIYLLPIQNFAIVCDNIIVGGIGINILPDICKMNAELGYWIGEPYWGGGIATEAVRQMTEYVFENFEINRIVAEVFEYNKSSMRVLEKNNYYLETIVQKGMLKNDLLYDNYIWIKNNISVVHL